MMYVDDLAKKQKANMALNKYCLIVYSGLWKKCPNEFALKTAIEWLNGTRLSVFEE